MTFSFRKNHGKTVVTNLFRPLTPTDKAEHIESYSAALDSALNLKDVRNIAITGIYGAGKSSFLRTYFKGKRDVLWVSLASFLGGETSFTRNAPLQNEVFPKTGSVKPNIKDEHLLEVSILQQIFYAEEQKNLPFSRLRRTTGVSYRRYVDLMLLIGLLCIGLLGAFQPIWFNGHLDDSLLSYLRNSRSTVFWFSIVILSGLGCQIILEAYRALKKFRLHRIAIKGVEMELGQKGDESILNRNIDDILYFFESTEYRTVVFEDIDRFNDVDIFTKLREINLLLNGAKQISAKKKPIRFVYALREDLFGDRKEKVKFFDFIVPIVPVVNASNSRDVLTKFLIELYSESGDKEQGQKRARPFYDIVRDVSPFLSDMRLVENICNEFAVYKGAIPAEVDPVRLFGMIVFKNFFPVDFAKLHSDQGVLVDLIRSKNDILSDLRKKTEKEIAEKRSRIEDIRNETEKEIDKLWLPYLGAFLVTLPDHTECLQTNEGRSRIPAFAHSRKLFDALRSNSVTGPYGYGCAVDWKSIESEVDPHHTYEERVSLIRDKTSGTVDNLLNEISDLQKESSHYWSMSLYELAHEGLLTVEDLIRRTNLGAQDARLLHVLVSEGYVDEQYPLYISVFHETPGERTNLDYRFEINVIQSREMSWDTEIPHPETVFENLGRMHFSSKAVFNFSLFEVAFRNYEEKTDIWLDRLAKGDCKARRFVGAFLFRSKLPFSDKMKLFRDLERRNSKFAEGVMSDYFASAYDRHTVDPVVGLFLKARYDEKAEGIPDSIRTFFEDEPGIGDLFVFLGMEDKKEIASFLIWGGFAIRDIADETLEGRGIVFDAIVETGAFQLSEKNLRTLFARRSIDDSGFSTKNYTTIKNCGIPIVVDLVDRNFSTYLTDIYEPLALSQTDSEEIVIGILNRDGLTQNEKRAFLAKQVRCFKLEDIKAFTSSDALELAIEYDLVEPSWENVAGSYDVLGGSDKVFRFVLSAQNYSRLSSARCSMRWEEVCAFAESLAERKEVSDEALLSLLDRLPKGIFDDFSGCSATPNRIRLLFKKHRIGFSPDLYERLKNNDNASHTSLAALGYSEMAAAIDNGAITVTDDELGDILRSKDLFRTNRIAAINRFNSQISASAELSAAAAKLISEDNYRALTPSVLSSCLPYVDALPLKCAIVMQLGGDAAEIRNRLSQFPEPISRLAHPGSSILVPTGVGQAFVDFLKDRDIVSSESRDNNLWRVYTKRT